ncbi:hypothetical protein LTR27_010182 [Elasticomyces elasticus]|nr:hypothetical protein LTR27_010182 [Elasticomyces elasticus]
MRLLQLKTLEFEEFFDDDIPPYAILSHRWSKHEISHKDLRKKRDLTSAGYAKIEGFVAVAQRRFQPAFMRTPSGVLHWQDTEVEWGWHDTVCIDKSSSSDLSEAINSMWRYYEHSTFCAVYLADVPSTNEAAMYEAFEKSEWFTRGW